MMGAAALPQVPNNKDVQVARLSCFSSHAASQPKLAHKHHHSLGHHHLYEFFVVDLPVAIDVGLTDHLIHLFICEFLTKVGHHVPQLRRTDESVSIAVKDLEGLDKLLLGV